MSTIINVVDSFDYIKSNCFQHQLYETMSANIFVQTMELNEFLRRKPKADGYISTLKLRSLVTHIESIAAIIGNKKLSAYDQDPWESFRDDGPWKDSYYKISKEVDTKFSVTSRTWSDWISAKGLNCQFVPMWILQKYCVSPNEINFNNRTIDVGFIGQIHPYRKELFDYLASKNINVTTINSKHSYRQFLETLRTIKIFIHAEDLPLTCEGENLNLANGLWIKEIEAISQGCYAIRNYGTSSEDYLESTKTFRLYDNMDEIPEMIQGILEGYSENDIGESIRNIYANNKWKETCNLLILGCIK